MIAIKRIYAPPAETDGHRVLIDRLWPRGLKRDAAAIDEWAKTVAPSSELRIWYNHRPERWQEFQIRYRSELATSDAIAALDRLRGIALSRTVTLLTASRNEIENHAIVLAEVLR